MIMKKKGILLAITWAYTFVLHAQDYTFGLQPENTKPDRIETVSNGATRFVFPAGTDLNQLGLEAVLPEGATVFPDPATARIRDNEPEIFTVTYADGTQKAFPYYFTAGRWFSVVLFGDPEINLTDRTGNNAEPENLSRWADGIIHMAQSGRFAFRTRPDIRPAADLVICMGDMDQDSEKSGNAIKAVFDKFTSAGIPFITMCGNHDLVPDYWTGNDPDKGLTWGFYDGGSYCNDVALGMVSDYLSAAENLGIENVTRFKQEEGEVQPAPFTFTFKGVRFYVGQTYWFQKPYDKPKTSFSSATYYAPNGIISALETFVSDPVVAATPSVWIQHYPISCEDRWWLDQNDTGMSIAPKDTPDYATAEAKRNKYMQLIAKTKNPVHFSGHNHAEAANPHAAGGTAFKDHVAPYFATKGEAFLILCHEGEGVKEIQTVCFDY